MHEYLLGKSIQSRQQLVPFSDFGDKLAGKSALIEGNMWIAGCGIGAGFVVEQLPGQSTSATHQEDTERVRAFTQYLSA